MDKLKTNLVLTDNKIKYLSDTITHTELDTEKNHRELEREYTNYASDASMYIKNKIKNIKYADFMQRRITYEGWRYMVRLADELIKEDE